MTRSRIARSALVIFAAALTACTTTRPVPKDVRDPAEFRISFDGKKLHIEPSRNDVRNGGSIKFLFDSPLKPKVLLCSLEALFEDYVPIVRDDRSITVGPLPKLKLTGPTPDIPFNAFVMADGKPVFLDPSIRILP